MIDTTHGWSSSSGGADSANLLSTALRAGRMFAYDWDLSSDKVVRMGDLSGIPGLNLEGSGADYLQLLSADDRARRQRILETLEAASPDFAHQHRLALPDGGIRWFEETGRGEFDAGGQLVRLRGIAIDVTQRREAEHRLELLSRVSELVVAFEEPGELLFNVSVAVGEHLHVRRCFFTEINTESDIGLVRHDYSRGVESVAGVYRISDYSETTRDEMSAGRTVVNSDSRSDPRTAAQYEKTYERNGERAYIAVPLLRDGRWVAEFWISDDVPRHWSEPEVALLQTVAERVWTAVEKLRVNAALRLSDARVQFVGESAEVGYWDWDIVSNELIWSPVCRRLFGVGANDEVSYARFLAAVHEDDRLAADQAVQSCLTGETCDYDVELRSVWPDGTVHWLHSKGRVTFQNDQPLRMAGITLDITTRKTVERQRDELLVLERRLRSEADEASVAKDHFLALLSHELRTPMTTILGWAAFLGSDLADPESVQKGIASIEQASRVQARLIDDLLDVSRIVTGKLTLEKSIVDSSRLVGNTIDMVQRAAQAKGVEIASDREHPPAFVLGDATRLQQVVWNLLSNAVKFTPRGGTVTVSIVASQESVEIHVRDSGVGIDPRFLPHVFERFRQADDGPSRNYGGLGLGLSIVRHIVELHGGTVRAASDGPGQGAEFTVQLPLASDAAVVDMTRRAEPALDALSGVNVLVIDDDDGTRAMIGTMLTTFGARVTYAASAVEAMELTESMEPDVLVSDIAMPGEDGYEFIRRLRSASSRQAAIPAVAVTAYAEPRDRDRAIAAGFDAHLGKPVEPRTLVEAVLQTLRNKR